MDIGSAQSSRYRPIAPRTTSESSTEHKSGIVEADKATKIRRAPVACMECRKYRTKCSTHQPCWQCAAHNRECVYDHSADKRRKEHLERREQQFQSQLDKCQLFITTFLNYIRYGDDNQVRYLVSVIRNTDNYEDIESFVHALNVTKPEPEREDKEQENCEGDDDFVNEEDPAFFYD